MDAASPSGVWIRALLTLTTRWCRQIASSSSPSSWLKLITSTCTSLKPPRMRSLRELGHLRTSRSLREAWTFRSKWLIRTTVTTFPQRITWHSQIQVWWISRPHLGRSPPARDAQILATRWVGDRPPDRVVIQIEVGCHQVHIMLAQTWPRGLRNLNKKLLRMRVVTWPNQTNS